MACKKGSIIDSLTVLIPLAGRPIRDRVDLSQRIRIHGRRDDNTGSWGTSGRVSWLNSAGIFEASPTGNNEDSASFITTCSSTLAGQTVSSRWCSQKEEDTATISLPRRPLSTARDACTWPLSAPYFHTVFTAIVTTTFVAALTFSLSLFLPLSSLLSVRLTGESRARRRRISARARACCTPV